MPRQIFILSGFEFMHHAEVTERTKLEDEERPGPGDGAGIRYPVRTESVAIRRQKQ
jgi:hypothetical protein